jgi:hypothetical protein
MADISMCKGGDCKQKEQCYRFKAPPSMRQSYFLNPPLKPDGSCDYRMEIWANKESGSARRDP